MNKISKFEELMLTFNPLLAEKIKKSEKTLLGRVKLWLWRKNLIEKL